MFFTFSLELNKSFTANGRLQEIPRAAYEVRSTVIQHSRERNETGPITIENNEQLFAQLDDIRIRQRARYGQDMAALNRALDNNLRDLDTINNNQIHATPAQTAAYNRCRDTMIGYTQDAHTQTCEMNKTYFQRVKEFIERNVVGCAVASVLIGIVASIFISAAVGIPLALAGLSTCAYVSYNAPPDVPNTLVWSPDLQQAYPNANN